jgi:hypothetical protein
MTGSYQEPHLALPGPKQSLDHTDRLHLVDVRSSR